MTARTVGSFAAVLVGIFAALWIGIRVAGSPWVILYAVGVFAVACLLTRRQL